MSAARPAFYTPTPRLDHFIVQYSPLHLPPPFCDFCGSLPPICLSTHPPPPSPPLTTAHLHPSSVTLAALYLLQRLAFILPLWPSRPRRSLTTALASAHHHTRLHPSVTFAALYLFCGRPIVPSWHSRPIPLVRSSPSLSARSPPHSPSPICDFCGSLPLPRSPHRSVMAFSAHPSGTFIAFPASPLAHHRTRLHPSVTFAALYLFRGRPIVPLWRSRPIPLVRSSPSRPLRSLTTALAFTHL